MALLAIAVYANGIPVGFVFDDELIEKDARSHHADFAGIFASDYWGGMPGTTADPYRPLVVASYAANYALSGLSSPAFRGRQTPSCTPSWARSSCGC